MLKDYGGPAGGTAAVIYMRNVRKNSLPEKAF